MVSVGFKNYKFFVLFLAYATVSCFLYQIAGISLVIAVFVDSRVDASIMALLCAIITGAFAFALTFFTLFHVSLVLSGQTTIEVHAQRTHHRLEGSGLNSIHTANGEGSSAHVSPTSSTTGAGWRDNWRAVFGDSWRTWLLPVDSCPMTGYEFDFEEEEVEDVERGLIAPSNGARRTEGESLAPHRTADDVEDSVSSTGSGSGNGESRTMSEVLAGLSPTQRHELVPTEDNEERV